MIVSRYKSSGFTLIEMALTTVVFGTIASATMLATLSAQSNSDAAMSQSHLEQRVARALDLAVDEFATAGAAALSPTCAAPLGSDRLTYRRPTGIVAGAVAWDTASSLVFENGADDSNNGVDDDGDGWIDEGRVVLVRNAGLPSETRTIIAVDVPELATAEIANGVDDDGNGLIDEKGLSFRLTVRTLQITLAMVGFDRRGRRITSAQSISIELRN
ncbi:MAG: type II secretion system protein [Planctomycetota bacterium]|nr:type II secretion system protein [Planctomycetota bacterium]